MPTYLYKYISLYGAPPCGKTFDIGLLSDLILVNLVTHLVDLMSEKHCTPTATTKRTINTSVYLDLSVHSVNSKT